MYIKDSATYFFSFPVYVHFALFPIKFFIISAQHVWVLEFSNFVYTIRTTKCITENKTRVAIFIFALFLYFPPLLSVTPKLMNIEISVKDFSWTTWHRTLKFCTNIWYDKLLCVLKHQPHIANPFLNCQFFFHSIIFFLSKFVEINYIGIAYPTLPPNLLYIKKWKAYSGCGIK